MLGLLFIVAGLIYLGVSIIVVLLAVRYARKRGVAGWKLGIPAGLVMYLLLFWDHVPTIMAHEYYCDRQAGFLLYKPLEVWKKENPDAGTSISSAAIPKSIKTDNKIVHHLNSRFKSVFERERVFLGVVRSSQYVLDDLKNEILAKYVDFSTGRESIGVTASSLRDYKVWIPNRSCDEEKEDRKKFNNFVKSVESLRGQE